MSESFGDRKTSKTLLNLFSSFSRVWRNITVNNPFFVQRKFEILIVRSGRRYKLESTYIDIYTRFIEQHFKDSQKTVQVFESSLQFLHLEKNESHTDALNLFAKVYSYFKTVSFSENDLKTINDIEHEIKQALQIDIDVSDLCKRSYIRFCSQKRVYKSLLQKQKPGQIYFVNYIENAAMIAVAKELNIETVELQHGLIIKEALTYHFPNVSQGSLHYFADKFYIWKGFDFNTGILPVSASNIIENKWNHLWFMAKKYEQSNNRDKKILIASQPFHSDVLSNYILRNAPLMNEYNFYYKVHPMEFARFKASPNYAQLINLPNVKVVFNQENVYKLLSECRFVIGIYSTTLFEANYFNSIPLVLTFPDFDFYNSLFDSSQTVKLEVMQDLLNAIKSKVS